MQASRRRHVCVVAGTGCEEVGSVCDGRRGRNQAVGAAVIGCVPARVALAPSQAAAPRPAHGCRPHGISPRPEGGGSHARLDVLARGPRVLVWACPPAANRGAGIPGTCMHRGEGGPARPKVGEPVHNGQSSEALAAWLDRRDGMRLTIRHARGLAQVTAGLGSAAMVRTRLERACLHLPRRPNKRRN